MKILILGGDGYLGWPTAMRLSAKGYEVTVVDNYLRRRMCEEVGGGPLIEPPTLEERAALWRDLSGHHIEVIIGDLTDWDVMKRAFEMAQPDAVVHYAEQPSAPYSMLDREAALLTLQNNLTVTFNVIQAVREFARDCHIVKLGTMGEYGTPNIDIEEGWIDIEHKGRKDKFLYPRQAGSLYHTTKVMDTDLLWFYVRVWKLRVTDLMQGPVYGVVVPEAEGEHRLLPALYYDEIFGTVLNRFVVQAIAGHPLTVYGRGGQQRGYLNILDTLQCVEIALNTPASAGELRIFNQFTETFSVTELAERVARVANEKGRNATIESFPNPRIEAEEHYYNPRRDGLAGLGLEPNYLSDAVISDLIDIVSLYASEIDVSRIFRNIRWS